MGRWVDTGPRVWVAIGGRGTRTKGHIWTRERGAGIAWARVSCQPGGCESERWIQTGTGAEDLGREGWALRQVGTGRPKAGAGPRVSGLSLVSVCS